MQEIDTLKELEEKLKQSYDIAANQSLTLDAQHAFYCIVANFEEFKKKVIRRLEYMDSLEKELQ